MTLVTGFGGPRGEGREITGRAAGILARAVVRYRVLVVAFWLVAALATLLTLPSLNGEVNSDTSVFLAAGSPSVQAGDLAAPLLGSTAQSTVLIVAARSAGPLTPADLAAVTRETQLAQHVGSVALARQVGISPDGSAALIQARVKVGQQAVEQQAPIVNAIQATFSHAGAPRDLRLHLAGAVATNVANQGSSSSSMSAIGMYSILFIIVLLLIVLRSPVATLITLLPSVAALMMSMRFVGVLGEHGLTISSITQVLLIVLILGAGTDYGLFLVYRYREELRRGRDPQQAVVQGLVRVGESICASAGTVVFALLTLLLATFGLYKDLAVPLALGVAVTLLAGLTLLPALLALFGRAVFPGLRPTPETDHPGLWGRVAARAARRPALTLGIGVLALGALAAAAVGYRSAGFGGATSAPAGADAAVGNAILSARFPGQSGNPANLLLRYSQPVWQNPQPLVTSYDTLESAGLFTTLAGPLNANGTRLSADEFVRLHARLGNPASLPPAEPSGLRLPAVIYNAYRASAQMISPDGRTIQYEAALAAGPQQSTAAMNATPQVRAALARAAGNSGASASGVAGQAASFYDVSRTANSDMWRTIPVASLVILALLALVLRSLIAPLYLIISVALSYLGALGATTLLSVDLGGQDGLIFILPFLMFVFLLALGEDYNILVMTRIREEARRLPMREAVVRATAITGSTVTSAGLILAGTFGVFALFGGGMMGGQLQAMGLGLALGILLDTFLVRTLLVPSAAVLLGRWNWWPSPLGRRPAREEPARAVHAGYSSELSGKQG
jgi:RND superfamily putative drug exporter